MDENSAPKTLFSDPTSKEALLGHRAYTNAIGLACQETLATTWDQEKREAISRLAEAWSDLEMIDPEGLYHIVKLSCEKLQAYVPPPALLDPCLQAHQCFIDRDPKLCNMIPRSQPESPQRPKLVLAQNNPHLKSHRRRQSTQFQPNQSWAANNENLPGQHVLGMEHTKQIADVLYERWTAALRKRWPAV
jgi:serine/threonine-protein kinase 24/25/MST4